jgi:hypothetical protein
MGDGTVISDLVVQVPNLIIGGTSTGPSGNCSAKVTLNGRSGYFTPGDAEVITEAAKENPDVKLEDRPSAVAVANEAARLMNANPDDPQKALNFVKANLAAATSCGDTK